MNLRPIDYESAALTDLAKGDASSHPEHQKVSYIAVSPKCCVGKTWGVVVVGSNPAAQTILFNIDQ